MPNTNGGWDSHRNLLHKQDDTSNKFYESHLIQHPHYGYIVAFHWGRIGAPKGQWQAFHYKMLHSALSTIDKKLNSKINGGYEWIESNEPLTLHPEFIALIEANLILDDGTPPIFKTVEDANKWLEEQL